MSRGGVVVSVGGSCMSALACPTSAHTMFTWPLADVFIIFSAGALASRRMVKFILEDLGLLRGRFQSLPRNPKAWGHSPLQKQLRQEIRAVIVIP